MSAVSLCSRSSCSSKPAPIQLRLRCVNSCDKCPCLACCGATLRCVLRIFPWKGPLFVKQSDNSHLLVNEFQTWPCSSMCACAILILFPYNIPVVEDILLVCCDAELLQ